MSNARSLMLIPYTHSEVSKWNNVGNISRACSHCAPIILTPTWAAEWEQSSLNFNLFFHCSCSIFHCWHSKSRRLHRTYCIVINCRMNHSVALPVADEQLTYIPTTHRNASHQRSLWNSWQSVTQYTYARHVHVHMHTYKGSLSKQLFTVVTSCQQMSKQIRNHSVRW